LFRQAIKDTEVAGPLHPPQEPGRHRVFASMRLPDWWPNPDTFDPGRFTAGATPEPCTDMPSRRSAVACTSASASSSPI
jgi:cytochrome P450